MPTAIDLGDPRRTAWDGERPRPVRAYVWPARGRPGPLILLSHGTGGSASQLSWLAEALAGAGFTAVAVDHHGNNNVDEYLPEGFAFWWARPPDLSFVLDFAAGAAHEASDARALADLLGGCDLERVGAAGFSLGGYTVAALLGARLNQHILRALFGGHVPGPPLPEFPDLAAALRQRRPELDADTTAASASAGFADRRVRAGLLLNPAVGPVVEAASLAGIDRPVMVRWADADDNAVPAENGMRYAGLIPGADGASVSADAGHYIFDGEQPDPTGVRETVALEAVDFFRHHLSG